MFLHCPNCREPVSFVRAIRTPAWGSFHCGACGSVLTISFARRLLAVGTWFAGLLLANGAVHLFSFGQLVGYVAIITTLAGMLFLFERIVLLDRRAFTCKRCGYDLQGLTEDRCPECAAPFDRSERDRIVARATAPDPAPRRRAAAAIVVVVLALIVSIGISVWRTTPGAATQPAASTATQRAPTASRSSG